MGNILLSTDFSDAAAAAYDPTMDLAKRLGASVTLFHVIKDDQIVPGGPGSPLPGFSATTEKSDARARLRGLAKSLTERSGVDVQFDCKISSQVADTIAAYANEGPFDILAVATHGRSGWRHLVLGSVTESILHKCDKPVICYPVREN